MADAVMSRTSGDLDFGPDAAMQYTALQVRWFDYHLRGIDNGIMKDHKFSPNNEEAPYVTATNTLYHDGQRPSVLTVPVVPPSIRVCANEKQLLVEMRKRQPMPRMR
jgi:hypothetical protein